MKFFIFFIILFFLKIISFADDGYINSCGEKNAYIVFDYESKNIVIENNSEKIIYPASLVKLMTAYLTFEAIEKKQINFDQLIEVSERGEEVSKVNKVNTLDLKAGDLITVKNALEALIVKSFNEASVSLSEVIAENERNFVRLMNKKALDLGMINTSFANSSGLHEEGQYTTVRDLARLVVATKKDYPQYNYFFSLKKFNYDGLKYKSHNNVLNNYKWATGMKTGYTKIAGYNLISSASKNKNSVISILVGCESLKKRDQLSIYFLDSSFKRLNDKDFLENKISFSDFLYDGQSE